MVQTLSSGHNSPHALGFQHSKDFKKKVQESGDSAFPGKVPTLSVTNFGVNWHSKAINQQDCFSCRPGQSLWPTRLPWPNALYCDLGATLGILPTPEMAPIPPAESIGGNTYLTSFSLLICQHRNGSHRGCPGSFQLRPHLPLTQKLLHVRTTWYPPPTPFLFSTPTPTTTPQEVRKVCLSVFNAWSWSLNASDWSWMYEFTAFCLSWPQLSSYCCSQPPGLIIYLQALWPLDLMQ